MRVTAASLTANVKRQQNSILGSSGHRGSMLTVLIDSRNAISN